MRANDTSSREPFKKIDCKIRQNLSLIIGAALLLGSGVAAFGQGTAFSYQGQLNDHGRAAEGTYNFRFRLASDQAGANYLGSPLITNAVAVSNGFFTVSLDFGGAVFTGQSVWLETDVETNGASNYTILNPLQPILPTPYAMTANVASNLLGSLPAGQLSGTLPQALLPTTVITNASADAALDGLTVTGNKSGDFNSAVVTVKNQNTGASSSPALRVVGNGTDADGAFSVSAQGSGLIAQFGNADSFVTDLDTSGNFTTVGNVSASALSGNGNLITGLNASQITSGVLPAAQAPTNLARLSVTNNLTGDFNSAVVTIQNQNNSSSSSPALRVIGNGSEAYGALSVSSQATGLIARFGNADGWVADVTTSGNIDAGALSVSGNVSASSYSGNGGGLTGINASTFGGSQLTTANGLDGLSVNTNIYLHDHPIYLRGNGGIDHNHGLAYNGNGVTNFPSGSVLPDGPVLWGYSGGALGVLNGGAQGIVNWNNTGASVNGNLAAKGNLTVNGGTTVSGSLAVIGNISGNNTPGITYGELSALAGDGSPVFVRGGTTASLTSSGNAKPAVGFFLLMATVNAYCPNDSDATLEVSLQDVSGSSPVELTHAYLNTSDEGYHTINLTWVVPISAPGGYQNFALFAEAILESYDVTGYNLSVLYIPRQNN